ncbi:MAG: hypothetical protein ACRDZ8_03175 [Acidimicrobiales bacterium]
MRVVGGDWPADLPELSFGNPANMGPPVTAGTDGLGLAVHIAIT